jgi:hypothetical protein
MHIFTLMVLVDILGYISYVHYEHVSYSIYIVVNYNTKRWQKVVNEVVTLINNHEVRNI